MSDNKKFLYGVGIVAFLFVASKIALAQGTKTSEEEEEEEQEKADSPYPEGYKANSVSEIESLNDLLLETYLKSKGLAVGDVEATPSLLSAFEKAKKQVSVSPLLAIYKGLIPEETLDRLCWLVVRFGMKKDRLITVDFSQLEQGFIFLGSKRIKGFKDKETIEDAKTTLSEAIKTFLKGEVETVHLLKPKIDSGSLDEKRYNELSEYIFSAFEALKDPNLLILLDVEYPE